jgi:dolichol-phosphate mannosyltransferase
MKVLIVSATLNEFGNIQILLGGIFNSVPEADVLIIDDSSTDGTREYLEGLCKEDSRIVLVSRSTKLGIGSAHLLGIQKAYMQGYDRVITLDADLSHDPAVIPQILTTSNSVNYVVGTRWKKRGGSTDYKYLRGFLSKGANFLCRLALPTGLSEYTTSYRCYDRKAMEVVLQSRLPGKGYAFFIAITEAIYLSGLEMAEYPITFRKRGLGVSKIPRLQILYSSFSLINFFLKRLRRRIG